MNYLKAEMDCIQKCVSEIEKMKKKYTDGGDKYDSVAQGQGREAVVRTINWLASYYQKG